MQVSTLIIAVAAELYVALLIGAIILFLNSRKLKTLIKRQQAKLLELLNAEPVIVASQPVAPPPPPLPVAPSAPVITYKTYLNEMVDATASQYSVIAPDGDISSDQDENSPLFQRILSLRYAFLRSEELATSETVGTEDYWNIFQQTLEPFLAQKPADDYTSHMEDLIDDADFVVEDSDDELAACKKRIENLEKFKRLFFDMEKKWTVAQTNAQDYYQQLMTLSQGVEDREQFNSVIEQYHNVYEEISSTLQDTINNPNVTQETKETKLINITRQDPRAAEEIIKLRNVAADQHRIINQLQQKLIAAKTTEEKESVTQELQQQLQRQVRFVQESESCIELLEKELSKAHEDLAEKEKILGSQESAHEENLRMKETLHHFSLESKDLLNEIRTFEIENKALKQSKQDTASATAAKTAPAPNTPASDPAELKRLQTEFDDLKKEYTELEEKYLELKMNS